MSSLKKKFVLGFIWSFLGQVSYLLIALIANVFLARLLTPYEFGQVGIVMFFIVISRVLTESGLTGALVRKNDATEEDFSTVFIFNLFISCFFFILLFFSSGFISEFYKDESLQNIIIALSSILIINAFQFIQNAKMVRDMNFKKQALYSFISVIISSTIGIVLAYYNYGVWSLVIMQIINALILTSLYWVFEGAIKKFIFSITSFKSLYKFGVNTTFSAILIAVFDNIYSLILGKYFSIQNTGLYYQAKKLQEIPVGVVNSTTQGVVFSTLSKLQDDKKSFDEFYNKIVVVFTVLVGLICLLIFFFAEQAILILYGEKWLKAVFFMKVLIIASFFFMQEMLNRVLFKVFNRTDKILFLEIIKKIIQAVTIVIGVVFLDIKILLYGFLLTSIISYFINYYHSRLIYNSFSWKEIITTVKVIIIGIGVYFINEFLSQLLKLDSYNKFYLLPFLVLIYFVLMKFFRVIDILVESKVILNQIKKNSNK